MALIKCPDCGKMFSEYAECCPECGCPTEDAKAANVGNDNIHQRVYEEERKKQSFIDKTISQKAVQPTMVEDVVEKKKYNYRWLLVIGVLAILVISGVFAYNSLVTKNKTSISDLSEEESLEVIKSVAKALKRFDNRELYYFYDGLAKVGIGEYRSGVQECESSLYGKWGYINLKGEEVVPCIYDWAESFHEGLACVRKGDFDNGKYGFINTKGEEVVPCIYDWTNDFHEGLAWVKKGDKWGYINTKGEEIIPCTYDSADDFYEGLARVSRGEYPNAKYGYINTKGEEVIPLIYDDADDFHEGLACVKKGGKWGYINLKGEEVVPCIYDWAESESFHEGLACVRKGKYGFINTKGEKVISFIRNYGRVEDFSEGMAMVTNEEDFKCGYINKKGEEVIPLIYDYGSAYETGYETPCGSFSCGLAAVCRDDKWGFINKQGEEIIPLKYDYAEDFRWGIGVVVKNGKYGYIDKYGHCTLDY